MFNPLHACDFYKTGHIFQYPKGTELVYSNFTARSTARANFNPGRYDGKVVFFGLQGFMQWFLRDTFNTYFFKRPIEDVVAEYKRRMDNSLGKDTVDVSHIAALHNLGYLPLLIKALPEGSRVNVRVPMLTVRNTRPHKEFSWLVNYIESVLSAELWKPCTTATTAFEYRKLFDEYALKTGTDPQFTIWQGHDFSFRGLSGLHDAASSGAGHLLSFAGTDTIPAIDYLEQFYNANSDKELVGGSVPATEHSVMSMGTKESEIETFRRLINEVYPTGIVSIVSDTWNFWKVITEYAEQLKANILARQPNSLGQAKIVFRPDSGDPVKVLCGDPDAEKGTPEFKGAVQCLYDIFGGFITRTGHKMLHPAVGLIYGDSITLRRAEEILEGLHRKGFASGNVVFGIGSYTYQYVTRDNFGFAMKATYGVVNGEPRVLFKDPVTDSGEKKSARGLLRVDKVITVRGEDFMLSDNQTWEQEEGGELRTVFVDGKIIPETMQTLSEIRKALGTHTSSLF